MAKIYIETISDVNRLMEIRPDWGDLFSSSVSSNPFIDFNFVLSSLMSFEYESLHVITCWMSGNIVGALPLCVRRGGGGLLRSKVLMHVCSRGADYSSLLLRRGENKREIVKKMVSAIGEIESEFEIIKIDNLSSREEGVDILKKMLGGTYNSVEFKNVNSPYMLFNEEYENKKQCSDIKRRYKKLKETHSVDIQIGVGFDQNAFNALKEFQKEQLPNSNFLSDLNQKLYRALSVESSFGYLEMSYLKIDGEFAAIHFGFVDENKLYYYVPGYGVSYARLGVGMILLSEMIGEYKQRGMKEFDFLRGDEAYKNNWLTGVGENITVLILTKKLGFFKKVMMNFWLFIKLSPIFSELRLWLRA